MGVSREHLTCAYEIVLSSPIPQKQISFFLLQLSAMMSSSSLLVLCPITSLFEYTLVQPISQNLNFSFTSPWLVLSEMSGGTSWLVLE